MAHFTTRWPLVTLIFCILTLHVYNVVGKTKETGAVVSVGQMTIQEVEDALQVSGVSLEAGHG